jgi:molecular chaperone DnaK
MNTFRIELRDAAGTAQRITPNAFTITVKGPLVDNPPLIHSVGVALANNDVAFFFEKGTPLPTRKTQTLRTALSLQKGQSGQLLRVPVVEGERPRADRNRVIGTLLIPAERITRDVPLGSEIEVTIEIDKSRLIRTRAFIPILGENGDFEDVLPLESATPDPADLARRLEASRERLAKARAKAKETGDARAAAALQRVDSESMVESSGRAVSAARGDQDAARQSNNLLNDLDSAIDDAEGALEWPALVAEAEKELAQARRYIADSKDATTEDRQALAGLERDIRTAIDQRSTDLLRRRVQQVSALVADVLLRSPGPWIAFLEELKKDRAKMRDPELANRLFQQADQAAAANNFPGLKEAVRGLLGLLPRGERPAGIGDVML